MSLRYVYRHIHVYKTCQGGRGALAQHWVSSACSYKAALFCSPIYPHIHSFNSPFIFNIFIFWLCHVFIAACRFSLVAASRSYSSLRWLGFSLWFHLLLRSRGSVIVMPGLSCPKACGIFPDQGLNPCTGKEILYHWTTSEVPLHSFLNIYWMPSMSQNDDDKIMNKHLAHNLAHSRCFNNIGSGNEWVSWWRHDSSRLYSLLAVGRARYTE